MFLEYWMLGIVAILTGVWAEYRNKVGYRQGIHEGIQSLLTILTEGDIIEIDNKGIITPKSQETIDVR
jgi:hypothetical protein